MSGREGIWSLLEIDPTSDIRKIKRAYARQAAKYHPEEFPEEFQQIHQAYEAAVRLAKSEKPEKEAPVDIYADGTREEGAKIPGEMDRQSEETWEKARRISELAEKYALEEERRKVRSALYEAFLPDIALKKLNDFWKDKGIQSHKIWCQYIQEPVFLEAIHNPDFLDGFTTRIATLFFRRRTRKKIKEVLEKEIPAELEGRQKLRQILNGKRQLSEAQRRLRNSGWGLAAVVFVFYAGVWISDIGTSKEQETLQKIHDSERIEAYIQDKYQITCEISKSDEDRYFRFLFQDYEEKDIEYYLAETDGGRSVPEKFHLAWEAESREFEDIRDDLEYETVAMCAEESGLAKNLTGLERTNTFQMLDTPYEEFESRFLDFLHELWNSDYVQAGNTAEVELKTHIIDYEGTSFTVDSSEKMDEGEIKKRLNEFAKKENRYVEK